MDQVSILSIVAVVVSVAGTILGIINHTRIRSKCFGKDLGIISIDIDKSSPKNIKISEPEKV